MSIELIKHAFELKSEGCYKQAVEILYKALEIENDNIEIFFQLGELYFLMKNYSRAEHYLEKVINKNSNHIDALKMLENIYLSVNNVSDALMISEKILKIEENKENIVKYIEISSIKGDLKNIENYENSEDLDILYSIAQAFYDNKKINEAQTKLNKILDKDPKNENALILIGKIYFDKSEFEKSKKIFLNLQNKTNNPEILNYLGLFALEDTKILDSIKYFSKASSMDKKNAKYQYNLGNAYFYNGWIKEATSSYMQAILLEPENIGFRYSLAYLYYEIKDFNKSQKEIDYILENNPTYHNAHVLNALLKFEKKDFLGAKSELETDSIVEDNFTLFALTKIYQELAMYDKAEISIKKAIKNTPESLNYKCMLAEILSYEKKYDEAEEIIDSLIETNENYINAYITGAKIAIEENNLEKAKMYAQNAISLDMNFSGGYFYLAQVRFLQKEYDEAIECMKRAIIYDVENASYYAKMSEIYEAKGEIKSALEYINEAESISSIEEYKIIYRRLASENRKNLTKK